MFSTRAAKVSVKSARKATLLGIELDDQSHARAGAIKEDAVTDAAFASAALPLLRLPARRASAAAPR